MEGKPEPKNAEISENSEPPAPDVPQESQVVPMGAEPPLPEEASAGPASFGYERLPRGVKPPYSEEAEQAVLGAAMVDKDAVGLASEKIVFTDFYRREHQLIFRAMTELYANDQAIDPITVADLLSKSSEDFLDKFELKKLRGTNLLEVVGGMDFLIDLAGMMRT